MTNSLFARLGPRMRAALYATLVVAATCLVYAPGLGGGFVFDDFPNIVDNVALRVTSLDVDAWMAALFSSPSSDIRRPLAMGTFALNYYIAGMNPVAMKATNIGLHVLNALLVAGLVGAVLRWLAARGRPVPHADKVKWGVAAAWALHPINLMAVLFVVQRMESLSHTFVFAGLWLYVDGRLRQLAGRRGALRMLVGLVGCTALGALSKESAALLPLYALCLELCIGGFRTIGHQLDRRLPRLYVAVLLLPAVAAVALLLPRALAPGAYAFRPFTLGERLLTEGRVVIDYLGACIFPNPRTLTLYHDDIVVSHGLLDPPTTLMALLAIAGLVAVAFALRARRPLASLGLLWFFSAQVMTATFIPLELMYEHRNYFASLGICLFLADLLLLVPTRAPWRTLGRTLAIGFLAWCAFATQLRARDWADPLRFASSEADKRPGSPRATYGLGRSLTILSGYHRDSPYLQPARDAMEHARRVPRSGILPLSGLVLIADNTGQPQDPAWWREMEDKLRRDPIGPQETNSLQSLLLCRTVGHCKFPFELLEGTFQAALENERNADVLAMYGSFLWNTHRPGEAEPMFRESVQRRPTVAQYRINLARFLIANGHAGEARKEIDVLRAQDVVGENQTAIESLEAKLDAAKPFPDDAATRDGR